LRRLADGDRRDHLVGKRIDGGDAVTVLEPDIDAVAVARRPDPVGQRPDRNCRDLREIACAEHFHFVQAADGHISSKPISETDIDEQNSFRRRRLLQESSGIGASEIQGCQEMLADRPTNLQIGLIADVASVTKVGWP
jgi:hypothetical protein